MSDTTKIAEMLDHLVNDDQAKAEELFHEYVVEKSREIYENLIESELEDEEVDESADDEAEDEEVTEASEDDDEEVEEGFEEVEVEEGGDETDDMMADLEAGDEEGEEGEEEEGDEEEGGDEPATKDDVMDLKDAIDELEAAFKEYAASEEGEHGDMDMGDEMKDDFDLGMDAVADLETVREYVEKVDGHGAEKKGKAENADNKSSVVAGKNDMGGTAANIAKGGEGGGSETGLTGKAKDMNTGNINKVGGSSDAERMSKDGKGHGAEKKGAGESGVDAKSIIGG